MFFVADFAHLVNLILMSQPIEITPRNKVSIANLHIEHECLMDCIHCGLCLSQCPTYAENGVEADSPRGRIYLMRALFEQRIEATPDVVAHLDSCLGCRGCETACPSGVQYGYLLEGTRAHLRETGVRKSRKDALILKAAENTFPYPNRLEPLLFPIRVLRRTGILPLMRKLGVMKLLGQLGRFGNAVAAVARAGKPPQISANLESARRKNRECRNVDRLRDARDVAARQCSHGARIDARGLRSERAQIAKLLRRDARAYRRDGNRERFGARQHCRV